MINAKKRSIASFLPIFTVIIMVGLWQIIASLIDIEIVLPTPLITLKEFLGCFIEGGFYLAVALTLLRSVICYAFCFTASNVLAYFSYKSVNFKGVVKPIISILSSIPTMGVIFLILLWVNYEIAPIAIAIIVVLPLTYSSCLSGYEGLDKNVFSMAKVYKISEKTVYKKYVLPSFLDRFLSSAVSELLLSFKIVISGEVMSETARGLGVLIKEAKYSLATGRLFAYVLFAVAIGALLEILLKATIKLLKKRCL